LRGFGEFPEYYKRYPSGAYISLAADSGAIYCAMPLSYPILVYDHQGNPIREIGKPDLMIKPYTTLDQASRKDFRAISALQTLALLNDVLVSVQLLPKGDKDRYAWDIFSTSGTLLKAGLRTDFQVVGIQDGYLLLVRSDHPNRLLFGKLGKGDVK